MNSAEGTKVTKRATREEHLAFRVTTEELAQIDEARGQVSRSAFVRVAVLAGVPVVKKNPRLLLGLSS